MIWLIFILIIIFLYNFGWYFIEIIEEMVIRHRITKLVEHICYKTGLTKDNYYKISLTPNNPNQFLDYDSTLFQILIDGKGYCIRFDFQQNGYLPIKGEQKIKILAKKLCKISNGILLPVTKYYNGGASTFYIPDGGGGINVHNVVSKGGEITTGYEIINHDLERGRHIQQQQRYEQIRKLKKI